MKNYIRILLIISISFNLLAQSNKKKIETLQRRFDSIASVLNQQVVSYAVLSQEIDKLKLIVSYLQIKNDSLQKDLEEAKSMIRKEKIAVDRNKIKLDTINVDTMNFELRKFPYKLKSISETYDNCIPKLKFRKQNCSSMYYYYDIIKSDSVDNQITKRANDLVQGLLLRNDAISILDSIEIMKKNVIDNFETSESDYFENSNTRCEITFFNKNIVSIIRSGNFHYEGMPCVNLDQGVSLIYDFNRNQKIDFRFVFLPGNEDKLQKLILKYLDSDTKSRLNLEDNNNEFLIDEESLYISGSDGLCLYFGQKPDCYLQPYVCIPFKDCISILNPEFVKLLN